MKRGPPPTKGFDIALPIALLRGRVMLFQALPDHVCDFTITGNGIFALVRLMTTTRLHVPVEEIAWEFSGAIAGLATIPFGGPVSRELWLYSRYGTLRFFRVTGAGLEEIDSCGFLFVNKNPVVTLPAFPGATPLQSVSGVPVTEISALTIPTVSSPSDSDPCNFKSPIIRGLMKKNAKKKPELKENDGTSPIDFRMKTDPAHKKPAEMKNQIPVPDIVIPTREPVAGTQEGSSCNASSLREFKPGPVSGKTNREK